MAESTLLYWGSILLLFAISVATGAIIGKILIKIAKRLTERTKTSLDDRILAAIEAPVESFMFVIVFYFLVDLQLDILPNISAAVALVRTYVWAAIVVVSTYLVSEASGAIIRWYYEEGHRTARIKIDLSFLPLIRKISKIAIYFIGLTIALGAAGFDITGLLAVTSIAGIILGLASQETLGNIFAGIALQLDRPFRYGDYIKFARDYFDSRTIDFEVLGIASMCPTVNVSNSTRINFTVSNFLGREIDFMNLTFSATNFSTTLSKLQDGISVDANSTFTTSTTINYTLTVFWNTTQENRTETINIPAEIGKSKFIGFYDILLKSSRLTQRDKITKIIDLPV